MSSNFPYMHELIFRDNDVQNASKILNQVDNMIHPFLINLNDVTEIDQEFVSFIEDYLMSRLKNLAFPYPIYIISKTYFQTKVISLFTNYKDVPRYYLRKERRTNRQQNDLVRKHAHKEKDFKFLNFEKINFLLAQYKSENRKVYKLSRAQKIYTGFLRWLEQND